MEKRIGVIAILVNNRKHIQKLNTILSGHSDLILGRMGLPIRDRGISVISLIIEGTTDSIGSLTGKIGKLEGVQVKSVLTRYREENDEPSIDPDPKEFH